MKRLSALLLAAGMALGISVAQAETAPASGKSSKQASQKRTQKKSQAQPAPAAAAASTDEDDQIPDLAGLTATEYQCELGNSLTIHQSQIDNSYIALYWKKHLHRMKRVETTTGANRFENKKHGLVWIDIPAKGMLLDSKKGQQLANECRNPARLRMMANVNK